MPISVMSIVGRAGVRQAGHSCRKRSLFTTQVCQVYVASKADATSADKVLFIVLMIYIGLKLLLCDQARASLSTTVWPSPVATVTNVAFLILVGRTNVAFLLFMLTLEASLILNCDRFACN